MAISDWERPCHLGLVDFNQLSLPRIPRDLNCEIETATTQQLSDLLNHFTAGMTTPEPLPADLHQQACELGHSPPPKVIPWEAASLEGVLTVWYDMLTQEPVDGLPLAEQPDRLAARDQVFAWAETLGVRDDDGLHWHRVAMKRRLDWPELDDDSPQQTRRMMYAVAIAKWLALSAFESSELQSRELDVIETHLARTHWVDQLPRSWPSIVVPDQWMAAIYRRYGLRSFSPNMALAAKISDQALKRLWGLLVWVDRPVDPTIGGRTRRPVEWPIVLEAFRRGFATEHDVRDRILLASSLGVPQGVDQMDLIAALCDRKSRDRTSKLAPLAQVPIVSETLSLVKQRLLDVVIDEGGPHRLPAYEYQRRPEGLESRFASGETDIDGHLRGIDGLGGDQVVKRILNAMDEAGVAIGPPAGSFPDTSSRETTLQLLLTRTEPVNDQEDQLSDLDDSTLLQLCLANPRWAGVAAKRLDWPGFTEVLLWVYQHTTGQRRPDVHQLLPLLGDENALPDLFQGEAAMARAAARRDGLDDELREAGQFSPTWYQATIACLSPARWKQIKAAVKIAFSTPQATRLQMIADVLDGRLTKKLRDKLLSQVRKQHIRDAVALLGEAPLLDEDDLRARVESLVEYGDWADALDESRESALALLHASLENLAAKGQFESAEQMVAQVELAEVADLNERVTQTVDGVNVSLSIDVHGDPELQFAKAGKVLKRPPAKLKKAKSVAAMISRHQSLKVRARRASRLLESAMANGANVSSKELVWWLQHPLLAPRLRSLVLMDGDPAHDQFGYLSANDQKLIDFAGNESSLPKSIRIAHPVDLLSRGDWLQWQRDCFDNNRIQSVRQVFREVFVLTDAEKEATELIRYQDRWVRRGQAARLLRDRTWAGRENGFQRPWRSIGLTAHLNGIHFTSEDECPLGTLLFTRGSENVDEPANAIPLSEVPQVILSETIRELDLAASVADAGMGPADYDGFEPVCYMRRRLLEETCSMLGLENVRVDEQSAFISTDKCTYRVDLIDGTIRWEQQQGEVDLEASVDPEAVFLPFAEPDRASAEILSKVLWLAQREHPVG